MNAYSGGMWRGEPAVPGVIDTRWLGSANPPSSASKHGIRARLIALLALADLVTISLGLMIATWSYLGRVDHERLFTFLPLLLPCYFLLAARQNAYRANVIIKPGDSVRSAAIALVFAVVAVISITFFARASTELSRGVAIAGSLSSGLMLAIFRHLFAPFALARLDGSPESEIVLVDGLPPLHDCFAYKVDLQALGITPDINDPAMLDRLGAIIKQADRVIVSCRPERRVQWALALKGAGVDVEVLAPELDAMGAVTATRYQGTATALVATGPLNAVDRMMKRAFDLALASLAIVALSPLLIAVAILIRLETPGPALFIQNRVGRGNRVFAMYKFRSMYADRLDFDACRLTTRCDRRVTRVGRFIRRTSIDELPQLFNVIRGDMSIVGPRPHATGALAGNALYWEVSSDYWNRHAVKPGLTGLAQVRGFRGNTETGGDLLNRLQSDLAYLDSWSIWRDLTLVLKTAGVLFHRNAF